MGAAPVQWRIECDYTEWYARGFHPLGSQAWPLYTLGPFATRADAERALALAVLEGGFG